MALLRMDEPDGAVALFMDVPVPIRRSHSQASSVTVRTDDAPAAVQAALANVAGFGPSSPGGGLIQTPLVNASNACIVTSDVAFAGALARRRRHGDGRSPEHHRYGDSGADVIPFIGPGAMRVGGHAAAA
jgi:hypothetical protein